jgi:signal transduction histidine kinase
VVVDQALLARMFHELMSPKLGLPVAPYSEDSRMKWKELVYVVVFATVFTGTSMAIDLYDHIFRATRPFESCQLDNIVVFLPLSLVLGMLWFSHRRSREANKRLAERRQAEAKMITYQQQLRSLIAELSSTEEREKRRLAEDLHDSIAQHVAIAKLRADALCRSGVSASSVEELEKICSLLDAAIQQIRSLIFDLGSPVLYEFGLEAALESLAKKIQQQQGITVHFVDDKQPKPLKEDVAVCCFRSVQELLVNVVKHAQARNVRVAIGRDGGQVRITVADDGIGFTADQVFSQRNSGRGFGLLRIDERFRHLGGHIQVDSKPGQGTSVTMVSPLA